MKTLTFKNGDTMPQLGLGTWKSKPGEVYTAVKFAIKEGYRHIDCAYIYGNEKEIGKAIAACISKGIVKREELWITSKLWNDSHGKKDVLPALHRTLKDLQLDYLDLYLIHWPVAIKKDLFYPKSGADMVALDKLPVLETWKGMEKLVDAGLVRHIGVSNFSIKKIEDLLENASIKPEMNQVECHPYFQQRELLTFCKAHNIHFTAYAPLGSGDRPKEIKVDDEPKLLEDPVIKKIANAHKVSTAQVLISGALHRGISVIPKSVNPNRILQNFQAQELELSVSDLKDIDNLDRSYRFLKGEIWTQKGSPYTQESLWD